MKSLPPLRQFVKRVLPSIARPILCIFLDKKYLRGRYFEGTATGTIWAIRTIWQRNILRLSRPVSAPMALSCKISKLANLIIYTDDLHNLQSPNLYVQNYRATVTIGRNSYIGPNVGLITANHNPMRLDDHLPAQPIVLDEGCWIGMNSVILPGVHLGPCTMVGAGTVVTKSFPAGHCVLGGCPARIIRTLDPEKAGSDENN